MLSSKWNIWPLCSGQLLADYCVKMTMLSSYVEFHKLNHGVCGSKESWVLGFWVSAMPEGSSRPGSWELILAPSIGGGTKSRPGKGIWTWLFLYTGQKIFLVFYLILLSVKRMCKKDIYIDYTSFWWLWSQKISHRLEAFLQWDRLLWTWNLRGKFWCKLNTPFSYNTTSNSEGWDPLLLATK